MAAGAISNPLSVMEWRVGEASRRLDLFLVEKGFSPSRSHVQRLVRQGGITVNGRGARASTPLKPGDTVRAEVPLPETPELQPQAVALRVVYEDRDVAVIDKPPGMAVHPGAGRRNDTLANALLARWPELANVGNSLRPGIVHRLDKDTSGLMVVTKTETSYLSLARQIKAREIHKEYLALVKGDLRPATGRIEAPVGRDPRHRSRMAVVEGGRPATTEYRVLEHGGGCTLVEVKPTTGRTHQIRVHMSAIGHPLVGDTLYGGSSPLLGRQFLHASRLGFRLPSTGEYKEFASPLPEDLAEALHRLREGKTQT